VDSYLSSLIGSLPSFFLLDLTPQCSLTPQAGEGVPSMFDS
jgi:hypothetical protein